MILLSRCYGTRAFLVLGLKRSIIRYDESNTTQNE